MMSCDLAINRIGALAAGSFPTSASARFPSATKIGSSFREVAESIVTSKHFRCANNAVLRIVKALDPHAAYRSGGGIELPDRQSGAIEIFSMRDDPLYPTSMRDDDSDHLVGLLPSNRMECELDGMKWVLRTRASVTACALERNNGLTKLWWTFEGIPADPDPDRRPTEAEVARLLNLTQDMEREAMPRLRDAYRHALLEVLKLDRGSLRLGTERLRVAMTENEERPVAALLDALYFEERTPSEIMKPSNPNLAIAREGMTEFARFVRDVSERRARITNETVSVESEIPGIKGVVCRLEEEDGDTLLAGFARRAGARAGYRLLPNEQKREEKKEENIRATSAARPLSAMLATREAHALEHRRNSLRP